MAERTGYYEHAARVRFTQGLIDQTNDWQWLVDLTEERFEEPKEISSVREFLEAFSSIHDPYVYLASIIDSVGDTRPTFSTPWLTRVYECVLLRSGLLRPEDFGEDAGFYGLLGVISYATCLFNKLLANRSLFDTRAAYCSNLHQLFDFTALRDDWTRLENLVKKVELSGIEDVAETLRGNFEGVEVPTDGSRVKELMDEFFDADFLNFKRLRCEPFQTWQETLLCDAFRMSFKNGGVEPAMRFGDGAESPEVSCWSEEMLVRAKSVFSDKRAVCVLEVIELAKWGKPLSRSSQDILVDLVIERAEHCLGAGEPLYTLHCTAFNVLERLVTEKMLDKEVADSYRRSMARLLGKLTDYHAVQFLAKHSLPLTKEQKSILKTRSENYFKDGLARVGAAHDLMVLYRNPLSAKYCSQEDAECSFDLFFAVLDKVDVATAELFYDAMVFYIDVLGNPDVDNTWVKQTIITLRHVWQDKYYNQVVSQMQCISQSFSVPTKDVEMVNAEFLATPQRLAHSLMLSSDDAISEVLEGMSEHALVYMFSKTIISEYYPDHLHVGFKDDARSIDKMIADEVMRVYGERSYRFRNKLGMQKILDGYFARLMQGVQLACNMIDIAPAYDYIAAEAPSRYELLPNPGAKPTLGHLTQLFPLLENLIRDIGELFLIVPFQATKDSFNKLRDVSGILADLVGEVRDLAGTIQGCNEFLFVYFVMYSSNGFNIRNDCAHGRRYQASPEVLLAFHLTVICTYMMLKRLRGLEAAAEREAGGSVR